MVFSLGMSLLGFFPSSSVEKDDKNEKNESDNAIIMAKPSQEAKLNTMHFQN